MLSTRSPLWLLFVLTLTNCGWAAPDAGIEAVLIEKPWFLGHGGVSPEPVRTGRTLIAFTTDVEYVDMRPLQFSLHLNDFMSQDGVPLDFDAIIRLKVTDSVKLIKNFGPNWYESNIEAELSNRVRQAVRKHGMNEMAINTNAVDAVDREVTEEMMTYFQQADLPLTLIQITIGKANPPDSIKHQRIETATQQQRQLTEHEPKMAEDHTAWPQKSAAPRPIMAIEKSCHLHRPNSFNSNGSICSEPSVHNPWPTAPSLWMVPSLPRSQSENRINKNPLSQTLAKNRRLLKKNRRSLQRLLPF